ncbi:MAG: 2-C-methyl-D-erythritol 2,4-cyclodiphosphate synthase [Bacteroidetes bacterium GWD2_45_23]|nr:MAG: 2-C-methyl-D-erythritol 2,4-cyclodiphosphate synthase [Bacteroidetes bacterium GWC2_46_850]OFX87738.1 MAG: 2-C-methyl-D-erythritol 2,4-cyclodiphosphate synthase [Bacteroidetes bacterium GWD2_45_23]HBB01537.1 2-C-methyl-D-erythritol 2,4-cyclodiphosphate synthase [Porphyromonadaceae bacterium]HCC19014.1 2-C-methyl-D-erythritol 2,4-cyclodiphosphate synthase [Porphyromonadaceae bacterium]
MNIRVGFGYDMHRFAEKRELWIGGVQLDHPLGLLGHSDADVLIHAICDAMLGAANLRDIGYHFPDTSPDYQDADSKILLKKCVSLLCDKGYRIGNIDTTVCTEQPKLNPHIPAMQQKLADIMELDRDAISIKATTSEKMGFVGREEGITAYAVVLIEKI